MGAQFADVIHAFGSLRLSQTPAPVIIPGAYGLNPTVVKNGVGDYSITLDPAQLDPNQSICTATPRTTAGATTSIDRPDDATVRVLTFLGGLPSDQDFDLVVLRALVT